MAKSLLRDGASTSTAGKNGYPTAIKTYNDWQSFRSSHIDLNYNVNPEQFIDILVFTLPLMRSENKNVLHM